MKFTSELSDKSKILSHYNKINNYYTLTYLDGSTENYYSDNPDEENKIIEIMINQAMERDALLNNNAGINIQLKEVFAALTTVLFSKLAINIASDNTYKEYSLLLAVLGSISLVRLVKLHNQKKELNKYKMYLEMYKNDPYYLKQPFLLDDIEFDKFFQAPFNINHLDDYSHRDVSVIYKKYKKNTKWLKKTSYLVFFMLSLYIE